jgi:hypothetical protein
MKRISYWAHRNKMPARAIIVGLKVLLAVIAYYIGKDLLANGILLPESFALAAVFAFGIGYALYPTKKGRQAKKAFYGRQKGCDVAIIMSTFLMLLFIINNNDAILTAPASSFATAPGARLSEPPTAVEILKSLKHRDKKSLTRQEKKILKKEFKKQLGLYTKALLTGNKDEQDKSGYIILAVIGALGLTFLLAALSCSIACNGSEGLAAAVFIVGAVGIAIGLVAIIRRIKHGPRKKAGLASATAAIE